MIEGSTVSFSPIRNDEVRYFHLSENEARQAYELAVFCESQYGEVDNEKFLAEVSVIAHDLPRAARAAANAARLDDRKHAFVISGNLVDTDLLGRTPKHWREADTPGSRPLAFLIMLYTALLGDAIGWGRQQGGRLVTDVLPIQGDEDSLLSSSSNKTLGWHTEDAFSSARGDYVGMLCLRNPTRTGTNIAYVEVDRLPDDVLETLQAPLFHISPDSSHEGSEDQEQPQVPVLYPPLDALTLRVDRDFTVAKDPQGESGRALDALIRHLDANLYSLPLETGDMCFVDNRNVVHGRQAFVPRYDGADRWLKRVNVVSDLRRTRSGRRDSATRIVW